MGFMHLRDWHSIVALSQLARALGFGYSLEAPVRLITGGREHWLVTQAAKGI